MLLKKLKSTLFVTDAHIVEYIPKLEAVKYYLEGVTNFLALSIFSCISIIFISTKLES